MNISGYDSSSINTLFSSIGQSSTKQVGTLGINFTDYASIRNGSMGKLMKSYYRLDSAKDVKSDQASKANQHKKTTSTSKDNTKTLAAIESATDALTGTAKELYTRSNNKVFAKTGSGSYDTAKIYDKVSNFVEDYNDVLTTSAKSSVGRISSGASALKNVTKRSESALSDIGIHVDSKNGALSIDKDTFMKADMEKVKGLFNGTGSYAYGAATQSAMLHSAAETEADKANTYGRAGKYNSNYSSGDIFANFA